MTRIYYQNESKRNDYGIIKKEKCKNFTKYEGSVFNTEIGKVGQFGKEITDTGLRDYLI